MEAMETGQQAGEGGRCWLDWETLARGRLGYRLARRAQDIVLSLAALVLLGPLLGVIALAVWLNSPGAGPFFVQERVGLCGRRFRLYKFRTMVPDAEARLGELLARNEMDGPVFKIRDDPRITRVGRLLRRCSIDELPQLFNVLKGDMSLVGPRPALPREVARYSDYQRQRLYVKPGLTCYWQVQPCRNEISFAAWVEMDLAYIQQRNFWVDWALIFQTFRAVWRMQGA